MRTTSHYIILDYRRQLQHPSNLVLEALEDELTLLVFVLPYAVFCLELVKLHSLRILQLAVLWMEHMSA